MSQMAKPLLEEFVHEDWIDYNGHMTDAAYSLVFSMAVDQLMIELGMDTNFREKNRYSIYTLETHLCYLQEAHKGENLFINAQLLDFDEKRLHVFFVMKNEKGDRLATSEQMLMGMAMNERRPAPFPFSIKSRVVKLGKVHRNQPTPSESGRKVGIRKKTKTASILYHQ